MYCTAGLHDTRVAYWEVMKFIAKISEYKQDDNIQVIRIETIQGHFGGSSRWPATICIDQLVLNAVKMSRKGEPKRFPHTLSVSRIA
jgi:prolyl oligopeptidase PreP (S9A serine peptidase family)